MMTQLTANQGLYTHTNHTGPTTATSYNEGLAWMESTMEGSTATDGAVAPTADQSADCTSGCRCQQRLPPAQPPCAALHLFPDTQYNVARAHTESLLATQNDKTTHSSKIIKIYCKTQLHRSDRDRARRTEERRRQRERQKRNKTDSTESSGQTDTCDRQEDGTDTDQGQRDRQTGRLFTSERYIQNRSPSHP